MFELTLALLAISIVVTMLVDMMLYSVKLAGALTPRAKLHDSPVRPSVARRRELPPVDGAADASVEPGAAVADAEAPSGVADRPKKANLSPSPAEV
jgi:hypothetical protein